MLIIVCILLAMPTACSESIPFPFKTPTPSPTSTPEGGLLIEPIKEPRNCSSSLKYDDLDYDIDQTDARKKVVVLDEAKYDKVVVIVADREEELADIDLLAGEMSFSPTQTVSDVLQQIDLSQYFVIGAFRTQKADKGCNDVVIKHITQYQNNLNIYIKMYEPGEVDGVCSEVVSAPCHIVKVERPESLVIEEDTVQVIPVAVTTTPPRPPRK